MRKMNPASTEVRAEIVTTSLVASGRPDGVHDLGRLLEYLNNPSMGLHLELRAPAIRPLYRARAALDLEAPLLVRREDIIFINFQGPHYTRGASRPPADDVAVLLLTPPFQIQGVFSVQSGADVTQALNFASERFFLLKDSRVFDADGAPLGDGETLVINGRATQMMSATRRHMSTAVTTPAERKDEAPLAQNDVRTDETRAA